MVRTPLIPLDPLETSFPILVVGETSAPSATTLPRWFLSYEHQHGGHMCLQSNLHGVFIPLAQMPTAAPLLSGFGALACDTRRGEAIRVHRELAPLHLTSGEPYDDDQLQLLQRFLDRATSPLPKVFNGTEALVALENTFSLLHGAPVLSLEAGVAVVRDHFAGSLLHELRRVVPAPHIMLAWWNSD